MRFLPLFFALAVLVGCETIYKNPETGAVVPPEDTLPVDTDGDGTPDHHTDATGVVLDEETRLDPERIPEVTAAAAPFLPPPFGQLLVLVGSALTLVINRKEH